MIKVSIIIPAYNAAQTIAETLESVLQQSYPDYEIILVDDGSSDGTQAAIEKYLPQVSYVWQENRGPAAARNMGIQLSSGEYLVFLDADDQLLPGKLETQVCFLTTHPEIDVVYSDGYLQVVDLRRKERRVLLSQVGLLNPLLGSPEQNIPQLLKRNALLPHTAMVRKTAILQIGGFDEKMYSIEDWDFWYRLGWRCNFFYQNLPTVIYKPSAQGLTRKPAGMLHNSKYMEQKVEHSNDFNRLPGKIQSTFFFGLGLSALKLDDIQLARRRFWKAVDRDPTNLLAGLAWMYSRLLPDPVGVKIFHFLHHRLNVRGRLDL